MKQTIILCAALLLCADGVRGANDDEWSIGTCPASQPALDAFSKIEAGLADLSQGVERRDIAATNDVEKGKFLEWFSTKDAVGYCNVSFGDGARGMEILVANDDGFISRMSLHLDSLKSPPFATFTIGKTPGWKTFKKLRFFLRYIPKGYHQLYFSICSEHYGYELANVHSFKFFKILPQ